MKTLVIGTGGREHALARSLARDPGVTEVHAAPGNPGMAAVATLHDVDPLDGRAVAALAASLGIDLVVVGPEAPLVAGVADAVRGPRDRGVRTVGRRRPAGGVEGVRQGGHGRGGCPDRAGLRVHRRPRRPRRRSTSSGAPYVVKDDGLAAGKGVVVTTSRDEAVAHAAACAAGVIEEYLDGPEVSLFAITDGDDRSTRCSRPRTSSGSSTATRDPTPAAWAPTRRCRGRPRTWSTRCWPTVLQPTVDELARRGTPFSGLLYAGLALTSRGVRVVEFNARFGDPETQPLLALLESPLGELLMAVGHRDPGRRPAPGLAPTAPRSAW